MSSRKSEQKKNDINFSEGDSNLLFQFQQYIKDYHLFQPKEKLLLAVSGGVDSIVLCDLCKKAGYHFAIAHCNFQLRNGESDADELFVREIATKYAVEIFFKKFETANYASENKLSIQVAARQLRYAWFEEIVAGQNKEIHALLTAHHANDNIETLLINFFKGTGIGGLQGIKPKSGLGLKIIRPLLFAKKDSLLQYAKENNLEYRNDSSNESNKYTRNYFRNQLIPAIKEVYPMVEDNLLDNINRFQEINILYRQSIALLKKKIVVVKPDGIYMPVLKLLKTNAVQTVLYEIVKEYQFSPGQLPDISKLLHSESGRYIDSSTHRILRNRAWLIISSITESTNIHFVIDEGMTEIEFPGYKMLVQKTDTPAKIEADPSFVQLDATGIKFPLLLRKWKPGDYFYPLGMQKKKKLSRFFVDQKMSMFEKQHTWVVESGKKIIWIAGRRIDDRFKIRPSSTHVVKLSLYSVSP